MAKRNRSNSAESFARDERTGERAVDARTRDDSASRERSRDERDDNDRSVELPVDPRPLDRSLSLAQRVDRAIAMELEGRSTFHDDALDEGFDIDMDADGGSTSARYVVERELGRGGLSVVYAATQANDDERVAIKVPFPHLADRIALRSRFTREARMTSSVSHPNIVTIRDTGVLPDGRPYLVTELAPGETLDQRLERGPLSARDVLFVAEQLLDAVAALGKQGIVHRDIKPSNIMVDGDEHALTALKLLDLGIAQRVHDADREPPMAQGPAAGTPMYMAPEQLNGLAVDARTDVYACGAVLYECVFGLQDDGQRDVRSARRQMRISRLSATDDAAPRHRYPRALLRVISRALDPQRKKRFASAEAMRDAMRAVRRASERSPLVRALPVLGGAALLGVTAFGVSSHFGLLTTSRPTAAKVAEVEAPAPLQTAPATPDPVVGPAPVVVEAPAPALAELPASEPPPAVEAAAPVVSAPLAAAPAAAPVVEPSSPVVAPPVTGAAPEPAGAPASLAAQATARRVARAREALAARDFRNAKKHAQSALSVDVRDAEAQSIAIRAALATRDWVFARQVLARYAQWHPEAADLAALKAELAAAK